MYHSGQNARGSLCAVCFSAISVPTLFLDLGDNSCEHSYKKKLSSFSGLLFREQPSEPLTEESIESAVHERSSDRNGWSAGQEKKPLYD